MAIVKYLDSNKGRLISDRFPKWTVEKQQAFSKTRKFGNILANISSDMNLANRPIGEARSLLTTRPFDYICESYITEIVDASGESTLPFVDTSVAYVSGEMESGATVESGNATFALTKVASEVDYLNAYETGFYVKKAVSIPDLTGNFKGEYDPATDTIMLASVDIRTNLNVLMGFDILESSTRNTTIVTSSPAGELITQTVNKQITTDDKSVVLSRPLPETIKIFSITTSGDVELNDGQYSLSESGTVLNTVSGEMIRFVPESRIIDNYGSEFDFNKDGVIDEYDLKILQSQIGNKIADYDIEYWTTNLAQYDLDGDGFISDRDATTLSKMMISVDRPKKSVLYIEQTGLYRIEYETTTDGKGLTSYRTVKRDGLIADIRNGRSEIFPDSIIDQDGITFEYHPVNTDVLISINQHECSLTFYKISDIDTLVDRYKIPLLLDGVDVRLIGSTTRDTDLYVLAYVDGNYQIVRIALDTNNITQTIIALPIFAGKTDNKRIIRDQYTFNNPTDIVVLDGHLVVIDQGFLVFLDEVFDIWYYDTFTSRYYTRSRFDQINLGGTTAKQIYFNIWNKFDEYGLIRGIPRLPGEENVEYKRRLLELFTLFPNPGLQGSLNGLTRELDIDREDITRNLFVDFPGPIVNIQQALEIRIGNDPVIIDQITEIPVLSTLDTLLYYKFQVTTVDGILCDVDRGFVRFNPNHILIPNNTDLLTTVSAQIQDPTSGNSRTMSLTTTLRHNETIKTHINYLNTEEYALNPVNGWFDASGTPTQTLYDTIKRIEVDQGGFWANAVTDNNFYDTRLPSNLSFMIDTTMFDANAVASGDTISGVGDGIDLMVNTIQRVKTDHYNDITTVNLLMNNSGESLVESGTVYDNTGKVYINNSGIYISVESGTLLETSGMIFIDISGELTFVESGTLFVDNGIYIADTVVELDNYPDLEEFHPVIQCGYIYDRNKEIYVFANKHTQLGVTGIDTSGVFSNTIVYPLSGEPFPYTPIIVEQVAITTAAELVASGEFKDPLFYDLLIQTSGNFDVNFDQFIETQIDPSGSANFHPGTRFAYTSGEARELVPTFNNIGRALNYLDETGYKYAHVNLVSGDLISTSGTIDATYYLNSRAIVTRDPNPILITYESSNIEFVDKSLDVSPLTTGFEDTIIAIGSVVGVPIYLETYLTSKEVFGESGAYVDLNVGIYDEDYSPVPGIEIDVELLRTVTNSTGANVKHEYLGSANNGLYEVDQYKYIGLTTNDIVLVNTMVGGVVDSNRRSFQAPSIGRLNLSRITTNSKGIATVRYYAPINDRKAFTVTIKHLMVGSPAEQAVLSTVTVVPNTKLGMTDRSVDTYGVGEISLIEQYATVQPGVNTIAIESPIGGFLDVSLYDAYEYSALKKSLHILPPSGEHYYGLRHVPAMIPVSGSYDVSGNYSIVVPVENSGSIDAILVYNHLDRESMSFDIGEVWR